MATPPQVASQNSDAAIFLNLVQFIGSVELAGFKLDRIRFSRLFPSLVILKIELFCRFLVDSSCAGPEVRYFDAI